MSRAFCVPGVILIFCALVLSLLVSISLPFLPGLDIARTHFNGSNAAVQNFQGLDQIRFGIWAPCFYDSKNDHTCPDASRAYTLTISTGNTSHDVVIDASWTRGLAVHPVATIVTFFAFVFSLSTHLFVTLIASLLAFLAATLTLIAFAIDIALFALVKNRTESLGAGITTNTAPGFWLTFVSLILLLLGGCTVCFGRRRDRQTPTTNPNMTQGKPSRRFFGRNKV